MTAEDHIDRPEIGPYRLLDVVGQAGMGVVWRAIHVGQSVPVAIKFLTQEGARDPLYLGCLKNEVRKVATLNHPAIVHVHDHGAVPAGLEEYGLMEGSPYLVMEYAEGGTLSRHCGHLEWGQVWRVLVRLLDGLAHAHARGVVHRDLKPGNVLLRRDSGGVMLTDFGLARAGDQDGGAVLNAGTPTYMAPEQIRQVGHEIGPWTDMYALGCLAWSLVCGRPPFTGDTIEDVLDAHLNDPVPKLAAVTAVPSGFEMWVGQLLRKSPHHRFVRAADAAHALAALAPVDHQDTLFIEPVFKQDMCTDEVTRGNIGDTEGSTQTSSRCDDTQVMQPRSSISVGGLSNPEPLPQVGRSLLWAERGELPPIPEDWREKNPPRAYGHLLGTGLGMFGLRSFPVVGREVEQTQLWSALNRCCEEKCTRLMVVEGADGTGKTHLAQWLARRSYEVGTAIVLRAKFQQTDEGDPLVGLIHSLLSTTNMDRAQTEKQIRSALDILGTFDDAEVEALLAVLGPFPGERYSDELMEERNEVRFTVIRRLLHRFCVLRPVVVLLDDAHLSHDAFRFVKTVLAPQAIDYPLMVLMTINTMSVAPSTRRRLDALESEASAESIVLGPLAQENRTMLVRTLLGLAPSLAALVERRSGGNPQFAVQLVGDWIQKNLLVPGDGGFEMRPGIQPEFPADMQAMWERRLAAATPIDRDTRSLQLAAELGMDVDKQEWEDACSVLKIDADWVLIDRMIDAYLLVPNTKGTGWSFVHSLVRESLKRQAEFEGHRGAHHRAAAAMLESRDGVGTRRGRHLYAAGENQDAIPVLLEGAWQCYQSAKNALAWDLVELREQAMSDLGVRDTDLRWAEGWMLKERIIARRKEFPEVMKIIEKVLDKTESTPGARRIRANAWARKGAIHRLMSEPDMARICLNKAMQSGVDDPVIMSNAMEQLGTLELMYGNPMLSARFFEGALDAARETGDLDKEFQVRQNMAAVYRRQGDLETARGHLQASLEHYRSTGSKRLQSRSLNDLAELDRFTGDLERAEEGYRRALGLLEALGDQRFYVAALNLGLIYAETGRPVEARAQLEQCLIALKMSRLPGIEAATKLALAHVHAQLNSITAWRSCFDAGRGIIDETGFADIDIARSAQMGGEILLSGGFDEEARESLIFARDHWEQLERGDDAAVLTDLLEEL